MAPDERRHAIVDAVVPLLLEHGVDLTTKQIAEAAGIAEGTMFRVFKDKAELIMAVAEETMNPADARARLEAALTGVDGLRERVLITIGQMIERSDRVMVLMMALRRQWMAEPGTHEHDRSGPPQFVVEAHQALLEMLTSVFEPHATELRVPPERAALLLRTLVLGSRHPGAHHDERLTPEAIADALLDGVRAHTATGA